MKSDGLPGAELIEEGLVDLSLGRHTVASLLVSIGAPRLRHIGMAVGNTLPEPEIELYKLLAAENALTAHSRYNALVRRLVSYERAAGQLGPGRAGAR
jgi:hypothetical protein